MSAGFALTIEDAESVQQRIASARQARPTDDYAPGFFSEHEYETLSILVDLIIPRDERSGSATDAGVPEFIDFTVTDRPYMQIPIRGGLAWIDVQCRKRFGKPFAECEAAQQTALLDDIAWPDRAAPEMSHGVEFFSQLRDLTASGFFSSEIGVEDLQYIGNTFVAEWTGAPQEVLDRLGVSYDD
jgi:hypothetical protein